MIDRIVSRLDQPSTGRAAFGLLSLVSLLTVACVGAGAPSSPVEIEGAWARPSLAPIRHMDDHDHMDHHPPGEVQAAHGGEEHDDDAPHHISSGTTSAAYFVIRNRGAEVERLIAARTSVADVVELHLSSIEDGIMRMRQVEAIEVPAGGETRLMPGGYHLMLIGLNRQLEEGDRFEVELEFEGVGERVIEVAVGEGNALARP